MTDHSTIAQQRKSGRDRLRPHSARPDRDVDALLCDLLGWNQAKLYTDQQRRLSDDQLATLAAQLERLELGEPLAYVRGREAFWSLDLSVAPGVLIPRPDTELLVEVALGTLSSRSSRILDLGSGSGAIALALASERPNDTVIGTDLSTQAIELARYNRDSLALHNVTFVQSDWYRDMDEDPFDLIVSNPPYIADRDPHVDASVRDHEPHAALFAGRDGTDAFERIIADADKHLTPGGSLLLEHGWQQHECVGQLLRQYGFVNVVSHRDLAGHYRVTGGALPAPQAMEMR